MFNPLMPDLNTHSDMHRSRYRLWNVWHRNSLYM